MPPRRKGKRQSGRSKTPRDLVRKRSRYLDGVEDIDAGDYDFLRKFVTEHGKIMPARLTGATAKQQRQLKRAIRRARVVGLLA